MTFYRDFKTSNAKEDAQIVAASQAQEFNIRGFMQAYDATFTEIGSELTGTIEPFKPLSEAFYAKNELDLEQESKPSDGGANQSTE